MALLATFTSRPGSGASVADLLLGLAERVRVEPGNLVFEPSRGAEEPDSFTVFEVYRDAAAFEAHLAADYGAVFNAALALLIVEDGSRLEFLRLLA